MVDPVPRGAAIERAAEAGLRSFLAGFETFGAANLNECGETRDCAAVARRLSAPGLTFDGSAVLGMDGDGGDLRDRTVDCAVRHGIATARFHIRVFHPYRPLRACREAARRITMRDRDLCDTRPFAYLPTV